MKKLLFIFGLILSLTVPCFAQDTSDIIQEEIRPDVVKWEIDTVRFLVITKTCEVQYRKVDADGNVVGENITVIFKNEEDNPETPEDESLTEFTQLINLINNNNNIKNSITQAVKVKLGLN
jgi:hypothetical protein